MRATRTLITGAPVILLALVLHGKQVEAADINWEKYMHSAAVVSAIAAAVALVDHCSRPLDFQEIKEDGKLTLVFNCNGNEDEEAAGIIEFDVFDGGAIVPSKFSIAG